MIGFKKKRLSSEDSPRETIAVCLGYRVVVNLIAVDHGPLTPLFTALTLQ